MRPFFLRVLGWTSARISTRWFCEGSWRVCGDECSRWYTWESTQPPLCFSPVTCHQFEGCPVAKPPPLDVKLLGADFNSHSLELGAFARDEGPSRRPGIGIMPIPMRRWISSLCRSELRALAGRLHTGPHDEALRSPLFRGRRATSLPNGGFGNGEMEYGYLESPRVGHTGATDAGTPCLFVPCVARARTKTPSDGAHRHDAAYEGRGATCCDPSCYEDLGKICAWGSSASQGVALVK
jgi:hypothetical protein